VLISTTIREATQATIVEWARVYLVVIVAGRDVDDAFDVCSCLWNILAKVDVDHLGTEAERDNLDFSAGFTGSRS